MMSQQAMQEGYYVAVAQVGLLSWAWDDDFCDRSIGLIARGKDGTEEE